MPAPPRLAFYAWPKPFTKPHIATIQRNAIRSWQLLEPRPDILLFGNDPGIAEAARELGVQHIPEGPPLVDSVPRVKDLAAAAEQLSTAPFLCFINADITLYVTRDPVGEWIGFEVVNHQSADGVALGECRLYDTTGPVGQSIVCAVANRRTAMTRPGPANSEG